MRIRNLMFVTCAILISCDKCYDDCAPALVVNLEVINSAQKNLYQSGKFKRGVNYKNFAKELSSAKGFVSYWDDVVKAPYSYNPQQKLFVTYDDKRSMDLKAKYVVDHRLNGIMFWELPHDTFQNGLLESIDQVKKNYKGSR